MVKKQYKETIGYIIIFMLIIRSISYRANPHTDLSNPGNWDDFKIRPGNQLRPF
jgi:hypothetical protein